MQTFKHAWERTVEELRKTMPKNSMELWIDTITPIAYESNAAVLMAQGQFHRDVLLQRFKKEIADTMTNIFGFEVNIAFVTPEDKQYAAKIKQKDAPQQNTIDIVDTFVEPIHQEYTFDNFIVGESNKYAHAACLAVARHPAHAYNPLFLYGNTGLGKTHLLYAIKNEINKLYPNYKTLYIKSEDFVTDMVNNMQNSTMQAFRDKYRSVDVLLVDDIQFIAGKEGTQDEFFHTFNELYEGNKQIILASDRPPKEIKLLESRLRSRFEMGIITDIYIPEYELKVAIIRQKAISYGIQLPEDVIDFVAQRIKNNIRQLEGVLKKMMAFQMISNTPPNIAIAQSAIKDITTDNEPLPVIVEKIIMEVSREFEISPEEIRSSKREASITFARQVAMYMMSEITSMSLSDIGKQFNGRDHSTVHHAIGKIDTKVKENAIFETRINDLIKNVKNN